MLPDGVRYIHSWTTKDLTACFQLMEAGDRKLLDEWTAAWNDIVEFDVVEVIPSEAASKLVTESPRAAE